LHWHETHDEYLKVVKGRIRVRLGDSWSTIAATEDDQPEVKVDRYVWHEWKRAEPDGEVIVIERTDPVDEDKALFFWNLNGVILSAPQLLRDKSTILSHVPTSLQGPLLDFWITLNLFVIFVNLDNFPVFAELPGSLRFQGWSATDWIISHVILRSASWLGWVFGLQPVRSEFTPEPAYAAWLEKNSMSDHKKDK
jgi:hypothetical protein